MSGPDWKRYVRAMCTDAWDLDRTATQKAVQAIQALVADDRISDSTIAAVLLRVGLSEFVADLAAPSIRAAVRRSCDQMERDAARCRSRVDRA